MPGGVVAEGARRGGGRYWQKRSKPTGGVLSACRWVLEGRGEASPLAASLGGAGLEAQHVGTLFVDDVARDFGVADLVEDLLEVGADVAVLVAVGLGGGSVALAFHGDDDGGPAAGGLAGFLDVDDVLAVLVDAEGTVLEEVVVAHDVGAAVGLGGAEADRAEQAGDEGDVVLGDGGVGDFAALDELLGEEESADVSLGFLPGAVLCAEGLAAGAAAGDGVLDAQAVGHLVVAGVAEEGVEGHAVHLLGAEDEVGDGHHDVVVLGAHGVLELQAAAAFGQLHALVVGRWAG